MRLKISESCVVSVDIQCSSGRSDDKKTPVWIFYEIPLGCFNSMFNFSGSWQLDAATAKSLAMVGCTIPSRYRLFSIKLVKDELSLCNEIKRAVPYSWDDPASLARLQLDASPSPDSSSALKEANKIILPLTCSLWFRFRRFFSPTRRHTSPYRCTQVARARRAG
ncbi:MACPF domain-containing protein CAD1-like [Salvia hispanica]|uniref:MACPF domain-containing protein CAD1-like n=1 Tax=Salvia hispanica TaxID=49212 RepID=UPI0020097DFC|nr:MACPF domain-containing protein CAD1-like [Salvia hispanica]